MARMVDINTLHLLNTDINGKGGREKGILLHSAGDASWCSPCGRLSGFLCMLSYIYELLDINGPLLVVFTGHTGREAPLFYFICNQQRVGRS